MTNLKNDYYNLSFILSRVLNTGTIMSIEKNEKELPGLENKVKKLTKRNTPLLSTPIQVHYTQQLYHIHLDLEML